MFRNLTLKTKLLLLVVFTSSMLILLSVFSNLILIDLKNDLAKVTDRSVPKLSHLSNMRYFGAEVTRLFLRVSTDGLSEKEVTRLKGKLEEHVTLYEDAEKKYLALPFESGEKELYTAQDDKWKAALVLIREGAALAGLKDEASVTRIHELNSTTVAKAKVAHNEAFQALHDFQTVKSDEWAKNANTSAQNGKRLVLFISLSGTIISLIIGYLFARSLAQNLALLSSRLHREAIEVKTAADHIAQSSTQISSGATQQAASLEETAASMNEITAMVSNSASSARKSKEAAKESQESVESVKKVVQGVLSSIHEIDRSNQRIMEEVDQSNREVADIVTVIETIRLRTQVINDIVFQTKLLSFNASVEAARAGESGKGFAVVADEVGKLAAMSGTAAKEITNLLNESLDKVRSTIKRSQDSVGSLMHSGAEKIKSGVSIAEEGQSVLNHIVQSVTTMEHLITEISGAAEEQSKGIAEINTAITQLDNVTQVNTGAAEESAASADSLKQQATELYLIIEELNKLVEGKKAA